MRKVGAVSWFFGLLLLLSQQAFAVIETYEFKDSATQARYTSLLKELRCPKCQNQDIADSNSPIAQDLRREVHRMLNAGREESEIKDFTVQRYGNFVLYKPPLNSTTVWLWGLPAMLVVLALCVLLRLRIRRQRADVSGTLTESERAELSRILRTYQG